jgi:hypothetical protein
MLMKTDENVVVYDPRGVIRFDTLPTSERKKQLNGLTGVKQVSR